MTAGTFLTQVRCTTLAHSVYLLNIWVDQLYGMDPFKLATSAMLEPTEPYADRC